MMLIVVTKIKQTTSYSSLARDDSYLEVAAHSPRTITSTLCEVEIRYRMARKRKATILSSSGAASKKVTTEDSNVEQDPSPYEADTIESCTFEAESDNDEERRLIESTMIELLLQRGPEKTC